jgi:hypothetical protein
MLRLLCHPDNPAKDVQSIDATISLSKVGALCVRYHVEIPQESLVIAAPEEPVRTHGLWNTTCFEAFMRLPGHTDYLEFNFSPSRCWAAYSFTNYREGGTELPVLAAPDIDLEMSVDHFALEAQLQLPPDWLNDPIQISLTAIIEETGGRKSYWALNHGGGEPDFHQDDCFTLTLKAENQP